RFRQLGPPLRSLAAWARTGARIGRTLVSLTSFARAAGHTGLGILTPARTAPMQWSFRRGLAAIALAFGSRLRHKELLLQALRLRELREGRHELLHALVRERDGHLFIV